MRRAMTALLTTAVLAVPLVAQNPALAAPAGDTTAPTLTLAPSLALVRGTSVDSFFGYDPGHDERQFYETDERLQWSATDTSGICGYDVVGHYGDGDATLVKGTGATHYDVHLNNYDGESGGYPLVVAGFTVVAHDCAGNTARKDFGNDLSVLQEDGTDADNLPTGTTRATGTWRLTDCDCALEHREYQATNGPDGFGYPGDTFFWTPTLDASRSVGVLGTVGPRGAARGAKVYVDGVLRTTVDTRAGTRRDHVVLWQARLGAGKHTVKVVYTGKGDLFIDGFATS